MFSGQHNHQHTYIINDNVLFYSIYKYNMNYAFSELFLHNDHSGANKNKKTCTNNHQYHCLNVREL